MKVPVIFLKILSLFSAVAFVTALECDHFYSEVLDNHGFISSFNYPFEYRTNLICHYTFYLKRRDPSQTATICFKFYEFDLEQNVPFCLFDFLEFQTSPPLKYCANGVWQYGIPDPEYPQSTLTSGYSCWNLKNVDKFFLKFSSDNSSSGSGFYATFEILESLRAKPAVDDDDDRKSEIGKTLMKCSFSWKNKEGDKDGEICSSDMRGWQKTENLFVGSIFVEDHTVGTGGSFLLSSKNVKSQLLLPKISLNSDLQYCLTFWYFFVSGNSPGVKVSISNDQMHGHPEWVARPSNSTPSWRLAEVGLSKLTSIQVAIATDVPDYHWPEESLGVVAIDDFAIVAGPCSGADVSCNFESSNCDWTSPRELVHTEGTLTANGDWRRVDGGGAFDIHEDLRGGYMSTLILNDNQAISRSLLVSPQVTSFLNSRDLGQVDDDSIQDHHHACFKFVYRFEGGEGLSRLNVRLIGHDDHLTRPVWSATNQERGKWVSAMADLVLMSDKPYKIVFEALTRAGYYVSLDGFSLDVGGCPTMTSECLSLDGQQCGSGLCIEASKVCDGRNDCEDGSDEDETTGCHERRLQSTASSDLNSSKPSDASDEPSRGGVDVVAASVCSAILGIIIITCLVLTIICLARKKKIRSVQRSAIRSDKNRKGVDKNNPEDEATIYQTLSTSNQSSANLCWVNGEERALRIARSSSSSDEGSDVMNINESRSNSIAASARRFNSSLCQPSHPAIQSSTNKDAATNVLDAQALRGSTQAPLIVASKYIISPDRAGAFVPGVTDRQRIDRMIDAYRKDIKIPNTNTSSSSSSFGRSFEASKDFRKHSDGYPPSDHLYEVIEESKVGVQPSTESDSGHCTGEREWGGGDDRKEGSIIGKAILV